MALIKCPECGHMVSDQALSCPQCGVPLKAKEQAEQKQKIINLNFQSFYHSKSKPC